MSAKGYDYQQADREREEGRAAIIARVISLLEAAASVRSRSLEESYRKGARQLMARHDITEEDLTP
jgi:hypothetical protein